MRIRPSSLTAFSTPKPACRVSVLRSTDRAPAKSWTCQTSSAPAWTGQPGANSPRAILRADSTGVSADMHRFSSLRLSGERPHPDSGGAFPRRGADRSEDRDAVHAQRLRHRLEVRGAAGGAVAT